MIQEGHRARRDQLLRESRRQAAAGRREVDRRPLREEWTVFQRTDLKRSKGRKEFIVKPIASFAFLASIAFKKTRRGGPEDY